MKNLALFAIIALALSSCAPSVGSVTGRGCYSLEIEQQQERSFETFEAIGVEENMSR